jgi:hypothetical protein
MARFDLYAEPGAVGFLLDVQTDLLQGFTTRAPVGNLSSHADPITRALDLLFQGF